MQQLSDYYYELPDDLIAQFPLADRSSSRLLHVSNESLSDLHFHQLGQCLRPGDLLVMNDTRVIPARLFGAKPTGGKVEVMIERLLSHSQALCQTRASKSPKPGSTVRIGRFELQMKERQGDLFLFELQNDTFDSLMAEEGHMPLPPYITRNDEASDEERYQTVYARSSGAVAAPTAGLHFDEGLLKSLTQSGVDLAYLTLHVGAGTFQPVRVQNLDEHKMHSEWISVSDELREKIEMTRSQGGRVIAVGTTVVRSLETAAKSGVLKPYAGETDIFIRPGFEFQVVDALITNFHLPESTLLMLVSAFAGYDRIKQAYEHAVQQRYRFFSYGDAMLLERQAS